MTVPLSRRWIIQQPEEEKVRKLRQELRIPVPLCKALVNRGVETYEEARIFFKPQINDLHDPFLMKDMEKAVERIIKAIKQREKILVYGDYDVDGTTAVATVYEFLQDIHPAIDFYIPDRYTEGYGVSTKGIDYAFQTGCKLIITLDCGIKAVDKIAYARQLGIDVIICDHHLPGNRLPDAVAILDPKQPDCPYPYKELSGCGIGFKLIHALALVLDIPEEKVFRHLDLVSISIASDIVPITGENRILVKYGLERLNTAPRPGLAALKEVSRFSHDINVANIVFGLGPRINAAGRLAHARSAVKLFLAGEQDAFQLAELLDARNMERREIDEAITNHALDLISNSETLKNRKTTVLAHDDWHKGVIGIVASRLMEYYYRPTILFTRQGEYLTGSARSVSGYDIMAALEQCSDLLEQYGGHKYAAGMTLKASNFDDFSKKFEEVVAATITDELLIPVQMIDAEIDFKDIDARFYRLLKRFAPFGPGNMRPVFMTRQATDTGYSRIVKDKHLKLHLVQKGFGPVDGIAFNLAHHTPIVKTRDSGCDLCYTIEENHWQGRVTLQINVKDIRRSGEYN